MPWIFKEPQTMSVNRQTVWESPGSRVAVKTMNGRPSSEENTIGFHMIRSIVSIDRSEPIVNAFGKMAALGIGCLPVMDSGSPNGILTERRLIECAAKGIDFQSEVGEIATDAISSTPDVLIHDAIKKLREHHARCLLVVNDDDVLVGLISQTDLLEASRRILVCVEEQLASAQNLASRDALTGLFSRRVFDERLHAEWLRTRRYGGLLALLLLDVDGFKAVNDEFGHSVGDEVLRRIGAIIRERVRKADIPVRYGGDEFAILMPESGTRAASILGDCIRNDLKSESFDADGRRFHVSFSGGVCKYIPSFKEPTDMLREADKYLYCAKRAGRDRIEVSP
jgi:diguanylate cyclase (GGDEF)-like protein